MNSLEKIPLGVTVIKDFKTGESGILVIGRLFVDQTLNFFQELLVANPKMSFRQAIEEVDKRQRASHR